jgi:hypothetical protein
MGFARSLRFYLALGACAGALLSAGDGLAVTQFKAKRKPFNFDITSFTTTLSLPVKDELETVKMSEAVMLKRLKEAPKDETIEPLTILMTDEEQQIIQMAEKIALQGKVDQFTDYLRGQLKKAKPTKKGMATKTVEIGAEGFDMVDRDAFSDLYSKSQHNLTIDTSTLKADKTLRREFMRQISPYFKKAERSALLSKIMKGQPIDVNTQLLPEFARKMVKKFTVYRGPNCFHAALAFQSPQLTSSSLINVKKETGYHRAMINYDELWRVLSENFYEVNPEKLPLKYGDMLVFFDVPEEDADDLDKPVDFKWIRHTATYLFGGYTFSKGSKSPNTPYTVRTLAEEWKTWKRYTENLGVKVFRRSQKTVKSHPPLDLTDWIY